MPLIFSLKKFLKIEKTPISEAVEIIRLTISADNDMEYIYSVPFSIPYAETLYALGIADSSEKAEFHFESGTATLHALPLKEWQWATYICANKTYPKGKSPSQRVEALFATLLTQDSLAYKGRRKFYWYKHLKEENVLFFQYNVCWDQKDRPRFAAMIRDMFKELDQSNAERLIIDLRQNSGGEPLIAKPLMEELQKRQKYVDEGRAFVLVGRRTYSAALTNACQLRKIGARTVGEPPRGKPNNPSEGRDIKLRSTRIWATVSTQFVERDADLGDQDYLPIEIKADMRFDDFQNGRDLALEKALKAQLFD